MDPLLEWMAPLRGLLTVWLFGLGAVIGSFLNVLAYRLPAGKSIVHPGSQCPACGRAIRWRHNLPIVSWLWLRGRCHDCGAKISRRYPLVELATALLFVAMAEIDVWPAVVAARDAAHATALETAGLDGVAILARYGFHLWLMTTLLVAALVEYDRARLPAVIVIVAITVGFVASAWNPAVRLEYSPTSGDCAGHGTA